MPSPSLTFDGSRYVFHCDFEQRATARGAGFHWSGSDKLWYTRDMAVALKLREHADGPAKIRLGQLLLTVSPWLKRLPPTPPGLGLLPHQVEAVHFALSRNRSYLGLDPGLGKTICAAMIARALAGDGPKRVVYIAPPFLLINTLNEFHKWAAGENIYIFPDSTLYRSDTLLTIQDIVRKGYADTLIVDEAHRFKNLDAKRTEALFGKERKCHPGQMVSWFKRQIYMSGTPMPNRPIELYPVLSRAAPEVIQFMPEFKYGLRYCGGHQDERGHWDFSRWSNLSDLRRRMIYPEGSFMLRLKKDLLDLPPKLEEVFVMSHGMSPKLARMDQSLGEAYKSADDVIRHQLAAKEGAEDLAVATYRRLIGVEKVKPALEYIKTLLEESDEQILIFAYHTEVVQGLRTGLADAGYRNVNHITGQTPVGQRQGIVDSFQRGECRVLIGNYQAMGIGFTLTNATRVIFVEYSYVPGENDQAADRAHRIGQTKSVLVQFMCYQNSIDKQVIEILLRKRKALEYV